MESYGKENLCALDKDVKLINDKIAQNGWDKEGGEFVILNDNGIIYQTEGSKFNTKIDENGYIYLNDGELVLHSTGSGFTAEKNKERLDKGYRRYLELVGTNFENFGENGFIGKTQEKNEAEIDRMGRRSNRRKTKKHTFCS